MQISTRTNTTGFLPSSTLDTCLRSGHKIVRFSVFRSENGWLQCLLHGARISPLTNEYEYRFSQVLRRGGITLLHIPCNNFASLFVVRFLLGTCEACIVPAFLLTMSMFFTYREQSIMMPVMWAAGNSSPITSGLLSYGVLWIKTGNFAPWKWFMGKSPCVVVNSAPSLTT